MKTAWLALQPGRSHGSIRLSGGFVGSEVDAERTEARCRRLLRRAVEHLVSPSDLEIFEPGCFDHRFELCFQQSTGDSALPQIDVLLGAIRHSLLHHDVADL